MDKLNYWWFKYNPWQMPIWIGLISLIAFMGCIQVFGFTEIFQYTTSSIFGTPGPRDPRSQWAFLIPYDDLLFDYDSYERSRNQGSGNVRYTTARYGFDNNSQFSQTVAEYPSPELASIAFYQQRRAISIVYPIDISSRVQWVDKTFFFIIKCTEEIVVDSDSAVCIAIMVYNNLVIEVGGFVSANTMVLETFLDQVLIIYQHVSDIQDLRNNN